MNPQFDAVFAEYLIQAKQARDLNQHHDFRRQLFLSFLRGDVYSGFCLRSGECRADTAPGPLFCAARSTCSFFAPDREEMIHHGCRQRTSLICSKNRV